MKIKVTCIKKIGITNFIIIVYDLECRLGIRQNNYVAEFLLQSYDLLISIKNYFQFLIKTNCISINNFVENKMFTIKEKKKTLISPAINL